MCSARERVNAGLPTAMAASSSMIAIGTSHGFVLVFDGLQKLKYSLGAPLIASGVKEAAKAATNKEKGAVSSLAFNQTNPSNGELLLPTRLLVGFAKGKCDIYVYIKCHWLIVLLNPADTCLF